MTHRSRFKLIAPLSLATASLIGLSGLAPAHADFEERTKADAMKAASNYSTLEKGYGFVYVALGPSGNLDPAQFGSDGTLARVDRGVEEIISLQAFALYKGLADGSADDPNAQTSSPWYSSRVMYDTTSGDGFNGFGPQLKAPTDGSHEDPSVALKFVYAQIKSFNGEGTMHADKLGVTYANGTRLGVNPGTGQIMINNGQPGVYSGVMKVALSNNVPDYTISSGDPLDPTIPHDTDWNYPKGANLAQEWEIPWTVEIRQSSVDVTRDEGHALETATISPFSYKDGQGQVVTDNTVRAYVGQTATATPFYNLPQLAQPGSTEEKISAIVEMAQGDKRVTGWMNDFTGTNGFTITSQDTPSWITVDPVTGKISAAPPAGTPEGDYTVTVERLPERKTYQNLAFLMREDAWDAGLGSPTTPDSYLNSGDLINRSNSAWSPVARFGIEGAHWANELRHLEYGDDVVQYGSSSAYRTTASGKSIYEPSFTDRIDPTYEIVEDGGNELVQAQTQTLTVRVSAEAPKTSSVTVRYIDTKDQEIAPSVTDESDVPVGTQYSTAEHRKDRLKGPNGETYVLIPQLTKGQEEGTVGEGENIVSYVYQKVGAWVPQVPGGTSPRIEYPFDPARPGDPIPGVGQVIPHVPSHTPHGPDGNPLTPVDPNDETKGYTPPTVTDPSVDTVITYTENPSPVEPGTRYVEDPTSPAGDIVSDVPGTPGTRDPKTGEIIVPPVDRVITVGTKPQVVTTPVPFNTIVTEDPTLPRGERVVDVEGGPGEDTTTTTYTIDPKTGAVVPNTPVTERTKNPIDREERVGVGDNSIIPFETVYVEDPTAPVGSQIEERPGVPGEKDVTGKIITPPTDRIIKVGTAPIVITVPIPFETEVTYDPTLPAGERVVDVVGVPGETTTTTTYTIDPKTGVVTGTTETSTTPPVHQKERVGTKVATPNEPVAPGTRYVEDPTAPVGSQVEEDPGTPGQRDPETGKIVVPPVDRVVKVGTKPIVDTTPIPFQTVVTPDPTLPTGERVVDVVGVPGERVTTTTYTVDPKTGSVTPHVTVTAKDPVDQKERVGSGVNTETPFKTIYVPQPDLPTGSTRVTQPGTPGVVGPDGKVITPPVDRVVEVGSGPLIVTTVIPHQTEIIEDPTLDEGTRIVEREGEDGSTTTTTTFIVNGETGEVTIDETTVETKDPVNKVIRVGTKKPAEEPTPEPSPEPTPEPSEEPKPSPEPAPEPSVEPNEEPAQEPSPEPTPEASEEPKPSQEPHQETQPVTPQQNPVVQRVVETVPQKSPASQQSVQKAAQPAPAPDKIEELAETGADAGALAGLGALLTAVGAFLMRKRRHGE